MDELMLTSGASAGLSLALSILTDPCKCIGKLLFLNSETVFFTGMNDGPL